MSMWDDISGGSSIETGRLADLLSVGKSLRGTYAEQYADAVLQRYLHVHFKPESRRIMTVTFPTSPGASEDNETRIACASYGLGAIKLMGLSEWNGELYGFSLFTNSMERLEKMIGVWRPEPVICNAAPRRRVIIR